MKWKKLGKIFDPTEHKLANNCIDYSQSPQALVFDDFVRVYFSTRERDKKNGKYLSHVSFVDFNKTFDKILNVASQTVIELGKLGCFDEHGIFPINPFRDEKKIYAYTCGWNRKISVSVDTSIGLAVSDDEGMTFNKLGDGPVLTSSLHEPFLVNDPFVKKYNKEYHMWYSYGVRWIRQNLNASPDRVYKIGHAVSSDGITWNKENKQIIVDKLNADECQALPTIIDFDDLYHMFFIYREAIDFRKNRERGYRIGYARSSDLKRWTRDDESAGIDVSETGWDSDMICYPNVFHCDRKIYMLYNGNEFGRFGFGLAVLEK